jgi:ferredoxin-NADP reductase/Na+-translocating ferredoxin:NAD+ oxidoreductase RnfD subunit
MLTLVDNFLNRITMYRLVLYCLIAILAVAAVLSLFGILPYNFFDLIFSTGFLLAVSLLANWVFARTFKAQTNVESVYITALILALIITPAKGLNVNYYIFLFWAAVLAMAGKYILAINKKHIFNPAAIAVVITAFAINQPASWWVGTAAMLPVVLITGLLIVRKIQRSDLVFAFLITAIVTTLGLGIYQGSNISTLAKQALIDSPLFFFAFVMLTEPLTTPPTKNLQIWYGILVGILFAPQVHIGNLYFSPELALVIGNIFSYLVGPKQKLMLTLKEKIRLSPDVYNFVFKSDKKLKFTPGQYLEWTLGHKRADSRGNRRYFTIASSPTENEVIMGVKFYPQASSFKKSLLSMKPGDRISAGQLAGDFTLKKNPKQKYVFIAGGIGITPFRSMIKNLLDKNQPRPIIMFYANKNPADVVYKDIFDEAEQRLGIKTVYALTQASAADENWGGEIGRVDERMIQNKVPHYKERMYYISGPKSMIDSFETVLENLGVPDSQIKTDFFPGFV